MQETNTIRPAFNETVKDAIFNLVDAYRQINRVSKIATYKTKAAQAAIEKYDAMDKALRNLNKEAYENYQALFKIAPGVTGLDFFA